MNSTYGVTPDTRHQTCVVDALGRAGRLDEAEEFVAMEHTDMVLWMALLGACRSRKDVVRAERIAQTIHKLDPKGATAYVLLANTYASIGQFDKQQDVRATMRELDIKKIPVRSVVEVHGTMHSFVANDTEHKESQQALHFAKQMYSAIKKAGYLPQTEWVLNQKEGEDKEERLSQHSEKLAVAYALIHTPTTEPIRVTNNLRVCGDCHENSKFISKHYSRKIIIRDANHFHTFQDGRCSCCDYW